MKLNIPEGMIEAANESRKNCRAGDCLPAVVEAVLREQMEHPVVPTQESIAAARDAWDEQLGPLIIPYDAFMFDKLIRGLYLSSEPEIPEAVKDLLYPPDPAPNCHQVVGVDTVNVRITEAFNRGLKEGSKG